MTALAQVTLSAADRAALEAAADIPGSEVADSDAYVLDAQLRAATLSPELRRTLLTFRRRGHASGGLLIRRVPIGVVPQTPRQPGGEAWDSLAVALAAMSVLVAPLGEQYGFRPELGGRIVQDILPVAGFEAEQISLGSTVDLEPHVEMAFSPYRSDYVALLCLRQDPEQVAGTTLSSIDDMLPHLTPGTVEMLRTDRFKTKVDASFRLSDTLAEEIWVEGIRVLDGPRERPHLRVDFAETVGTDAAARAALAELQAAAVRVATTTRLRAGDLLVIDNHRAVHGRTPFRPRYDGSDRWLLRSFVTKDLRPSEQVRRADSRIVEADYGPADAASGPSS
jgi:L-asparagine oxygenase